MIALVTGPVRSGKSAFAMQLARATGNVPVYIATATVDATDAEMTARVARHRADRGSMRSIETDEREGPSLAATVSALGAGETAIVDSLGSWLSAHLLAFAARTDDPVALAAALEERASEILPVFAGAHAGLVVVAEEAGWGVVPASLLGRIFRDQMGRSTSALAELADRAYLVVAGYAIDLKAAGTRVNG